MIIVIYYFFTLRVAQTAIQLKTKYIVDCTTRNIKLFLNTLRVIQTAIQNIF